MIGKLIFPVQEGPPPVYIGFGSITIEDPMALSKLVSDALARAGLRAILTKGWGGLGDNVAFGKHVFLLPSVPHDWLFPQVSAVCHHGGAGTLAAGLRAGKPTIVVSFFGDQFFWGQRVEELGAGLHVPFKRLTLDSLHEALRRVTGEQAIRDAAAVIGKKINAEDGCENAVAAFHRHFDTAYVPPTFVPDSECPTCVKCGASFGLSNTRHHCRNCGKVFCGDCSKTFMPLEHFSFFDPVRVCDLCVAPVKQRKPSVSVTSPPQPRSISPVSQPATPSITQSQPLPPPHP